MNTRRPITLPSVGIPRQPVKAEEAEAALQSRFTAAVKPTIDSSTEPEEETNDMANATVEELPADEETNLQERSVDELRDEAFEKVKTLGRDAIKGEASLVNLAETLVDGAMQGVFIIKPPQNDAKNAYEMFRNPDQGTRRQNAVKRIDTQSESSFNSNVKKLEWFIKLGSDFRHEGAGKQFFNQAKDVHLSMLADEQERKGLKLRATYEAVLAIVRKYMMQQDAKTGRYPPFPSADEMRAWLRKEEPDFKDGIDALAEAMLALKKAEKGKNANEKTGDPGFLKIDDPLLTSAMKNITDLVAKLDNLMSGTGVQHRFTLLTTPKKRPKKDDKGNGGNGNGNNADIPIEDEEEEETEGE